VAVSPKRKGRGCAGTRCGCSCSTPRRRAPTWRRTGSSSSARPTSAGLRRTLVDPERPIPPEASAVHGIRDEDVRGQPVFAKVAPRLVAHLDGSESGGAPPVVCGYNAVGYDVPLLNHELARAGLDYRIDPSRVLDVILFVRWHHRGLRSRKLGDVCAHYGVRLDSAHAAWADAAATGHLLFAMVQRGVVPADVDEALAMQAGFAPRLEAEWSRWSYWLYEDRADGILRLGAGKHCGTPLEKADPRYLAFVVDTIGDLPDAVREAFSRRLRR
jgi:DNA polymerase-3 subunit epsilon